MNSTANPIMDVLDEAQGGQLMATLAMACDLDETRTRSVLERLTPDIARRIARLASDEEAYEDLLEVLDEEEQIDYLDSPRAMLGSDVISDGEDILKLLYGSLDDAHAEARSIGAPDGVDDGIFTRLMTLAASLTLAALARRNQRFQLSTGGDNTGGDTAASGGDGLVAMFISALITGLLQALRQSVRPRRRRRRGNILTKIFGTDKKRRRRRKSSRRRKSRRRKTPTLNDLLGDLLGG